MNFGLCFFMYHDITGKHHILGGLAKNNFVFSGHSLGLILSIISCVVLWCPLGSHRGFPCSCKFGVFFPSRPACANKSTFFFFYSCGFLPKTVLTALYQADMWNWIYTMCGRENWLPGCQYFSFLFQNICCGFYSFAWFLLSSPGFLFVSAACYPWISRLLWVGWLVSPGPC